MAALRVGTCGDEDAVGFLDTHAHTAPTQRIDGALEVVDGDGDAKEALALCLQSARHRPVARQWRCQYHRTRG